MASIHKENFTEQAKMYVLLHVMEIICNSLSLPLSPPLSLPLSYSSQAMRRESTDVPCSGFVREMMVSIIIFLNVTTSSFFSLSQLEYSRNTFHYFPVKRTLLRC